MTTDVPNKMNNVCMVLTVSDVNGFLGNKNAAGSKLYSSLVIMYRQFSINMFLLQHFSQIVVVFYV